ncbi:MAG: hypothetical protein Q8O14_01520 [bacterium]|nr:hypothetical protein [bacterium]
MLRDVPDHPTFVVIPGSVSGENFEFANKVTEVLVSCGVKIIDRPAMLSNFTESTGTGSGMTLGSVSASGGQSAQVLGFGSASSRGETATQTVDVVDLYNQTQADYIVVVFSRGSWVKIVQKDTNQVVYGGSLTMINDSWNGSGRNYGRKEFLGILKSMGVGI